MHASVLKKSPCFVSSWWTFDDLICGWLLVWRFPKLPSHDYLSILSPIKLPYFIANFLPKGVINLKDSLCRLMCLQNIDVLFTYLLCNSWYHIWRRMLVVFHSYSSLNANTFSKRNKLVPSSKAIKFSLFILKCFYHNRNKLRYSLSLWRRFHQNDSFTFYLNNDNWLLSSPMVISGRL